MKVRFAALAILLGSGAALAVQPDRAGCGDHRLFPTRMPNYRIGSCEVKEFDAYTFRLNGGKKQRVEGKFTFITYVVDDRKDDQSGIAVIRNYENAMKRIGGTVQGSDGQRWVKSVGGRGREGSLGRGREGKLGDLAPRSSRSRRWRSTSSRTRPPSGTT